MRKFASLLLIMIMLLGSIACQPTPDEEVIAYRGDGVMEEKIFGKSALEMGVTKPPHWTKTIQLSDSLAV